LGDNNLDKKDYSKIYHWYDEEEQKEVIQKKKSKKVLRRESREKEKKRKVELKKEREKVRVTKKGRIGIIIGAVVVVVAVICWVLFGYLGIGIDFTKTLATVNGIKITKKDVNIYMEFLKNQNPDSIPPENDPQFKVLQENILDSIIVLKLLEEYGKQNGFSVTEKEISDEYDKLVKNYQSEAEFEKDLKAKKVTKEFLEEQISNQLLRDKIFNKETANVVVSDAEIKKYYDDNDETTFKVPEQVRVSHILIKFNIPEGQQLNDSIKNEAKVKISDIEKQLAEGGDFAELAKKYSEDTVSAPNGGDIGFVSKGQTVAEFEDVAFKLEVGEVSPIVETYYGYHLIKVTEKKDSYIKSFDEVRDTIESYLVNNKKMKVWEDFVYLLIDKAEIKYTSGIKGQLLNIEETTESSGSSSTS
jgi:parvulin-like peptidyl-prolyl isomerase